MTMRIETTNQQPGSTGEGRSRIDHRDRVNDAAVVPLKWWIAESDEHIVIQSSSEFALH
jgi:hypothetical protein